MRNAARSIKTLAVLSLVIPAVVFGLAARNSYQSRFAEAEEHLQRTAQVTREHAIKVFETLRLAALQVDEILYNQSDEAIHINESVLRSRLRQLAASLPQIEDIWVLDENGRPLITAGIIPVRNDLDFSDRAYFKVHKEETVAPGMAYISAPLHGRIRHDNIFFDYSVQRRRDAGRFSGVIAIAVSPQYFRDFYVEIAKNGVSAVALIRADGVHLARFPGEVAGLPSLPDAPDLPAQIKDGHGEGVFSRTSNIDHAERIVAYSSLPEYPVYVLLGLDRDVVTGAWKSNLISWMLFGVPATAALFGMCLVALHHTRKGQAVNLKLQEEIRRREESEEHVRQMQKMEALGQLTGGIAHDFNNLLTIILGSLEMISRRLARGDTAIQPFLDAASQGAQRAATLTARLLAFARKQPLDPKPLDPNKLISGMANLIRSTVGERIVAETVLGAGLWSTNIDGNQLENAIINLAVNARDAMPEGGKLTIETGNAYIDEAYAAAEGLTPGQYVAIEVTDTGCGMPQDVAKKAFDPFFTTKANGQGTGLGLSQVFGFVKQSGGHIRIYSEEGRGTSVKIYLPRHLGAGDKPEPRNAGAIAGLRGAEKILLVEDEDGVRNFGRQALEELGYNVLDASNGAAALEILERDDGVTLLLTDIVMPGMDGKELADRAQRLRPDLKVLYTTGYSRNAIVHNGVLDPGVALINKPFTVEQIARKIRHLIGS